MSTDPTGRQFLVDYDPEPGVEMSTAVVEAVSSVADVPPGQLQPLAHTIDPDALDRLFSTSLPGTEVQFSYGKYLVVVRGDRTIEVYRERSTRHWCGP